MLVIDAHEKQLVDTFVEMGRETLKEFRDREGRQIIPADSGFDRRHIMCESDTWLSSPPTSK